MNSMARRLLVSAVRKLLPDAVPETSVTALALRPSDREIEILPPVDRRSSLASLSRSFPTARPSQTLYAPPPALQPVAVPLPAPRRRVRKVVTSERIYMEGKW